MVGNSGSLSLKLVEKLVNDRSGKVQKIIGLQIELSLRETKQLVQDLEETDREGTRIQSIILHHYTQAIYFLRLNNFTSCVFPSSL